MKRATLAKRIRQAKDDNEARQLATYGRTVSQAEGLTHDYIDCAVVLFKARHSKKHPNSLSEIADGIIAAMENTQQGIKDKLSKQLLTALDCLDAQLFHQVADVIGARLKKLILTPVDPLRLHLVELRRVQKGVPKLAPVKYVFNGKQTQENLEQFGKYGKSPDYFRRVARELGVEYVKGRGGRPKETQRRKGRKKAYES